MTMLKWTFVDRASNTTLDFLGDAADADAFYETLKAGGEGEWALDVERSMDAILAAQQAEMEAQAENGKTENGKVVPIAPPPSFLQTARRSGKRQYERFDVGFRVVITHGELSFRTRTRNVSVGGALLEHKLPEGLSDRECSIFIGGMDSRCNIQMRCRVVGDAGNPMRVRFVGAEADRLRELEGWILSAAGAAGAEENDGGALKKAA